MAVFPHIRPPFSALVLAVGLLLSLACPAFARDNYITTDPLAAAVMPAPSRGASVFIPSFVPPKGRISAFEMPHESQTPERYPTPGLTPKEPMSPVNVSLTVPQSNAIFPPGAMVTFGWLPAEMNVSDEDAPTKVQHPIRYEIFVTRHDQFSARLFVKSSVTMREYTYIYTPPGPGRYTWHIRAIFNRAMHGLHSETRSFLVLP